MAAYEDSVALHQAEVAASLAAPGPALERLWRGVHAYVAMQSAHRDYARTFNVEVLAAGPLARERHQAPSPSAEPSRAASGVAHAMPERITRDGS